MRAMLTGMNDKKCPDCGEFKSRDDFYRNKSARDGLNSYCKPCWAVRARAQRDKTKSATVEAPQEKRCPSCGETKPRSEFRADRTKADHLTSACSACISQRSRDYYQRNRDRIRANVKAYQKAKPEVQARAVARRRENGKRRAADVKGKYGLTEGEYAALLERSGGLCEICGRVPSEVSKKGVCVDHCHDSGRVRGILCAPCNMGIGHLRDDPEVLRAAIGYLERAVVH